MHSIHASTSTSTSTSPEQTPDVDWPPSTLDLEPEVCHCLVHGAELPCSACGSEAENERSPRGGGFVRSECG